MMCLIYSKLQYKDNHIFANATYYYVKRGGDKNRKEDDRVSFLINLLLSMNFKIINLALSFKVIHL